MNEHALMKAAERVAYLKLIVRLTRAVHLEWGCDWIKDGGCPFCEPGIYGKTETVADRFDRWAEHDFDERATTERAAEEILAILDAEGEQPIPHPEDGAR